AKHVTARQAALFHRGAGQSGKPNDVPGAIDVGNRSLKVVIDSQFTSPICSKSRSLEIEPITVGLSTNGVKQTLTMNALAAGQFGNDSVALLVKSHRNHFLAETKHGTQLAQLETQTLHDLSINKIQQSGTLIKERHFDSQRGKHGGVFQPNN